MNRINPEFHDWLTYVEVAHLLMVAPKTIRNRMSLHQLPRVIVRIGRKKRRIARISPDTVRTLARLIGTAPWIAN